MGGVLAWDVHSKHPHPGLFEREVSMGLRITSSTWNSIGLYSLATNFAALNKSSEKLASGLRINRASDDPAGLIISERLRTQIASMNQEIENLSLSINKYQTVSSSVSGLRSKLTELRTLAVGAANEGLNSESTQQAYATSANDIVESYNEAVQNAEYNGSPTLDGSEHALGDVAELTGIDLSTGASATESIERIDEAISELDALQIELGSTQKNDLESRQSSLRIARQNMVAAESTIRDVDYAEEVTNRLGFLIRTQVATAMLAQSNMAGSIVLKLFDS